MTNENNTPSAADTGSIIIGIMSLIVVVYRIIVLMIPMFTKAIHEKNIKNIFQSLTMLV